MQFQITDLYRIKSDRYCWRVQRYVGVYKSGGDANSKYDTLTYHTSLESALGGVFGLMVRESDATTIREARAAVQLIVAAINKAQKSIRALEANQ